MINKLAFLLITLILFTNNKILAQKKENNKIEIVKNNNAISSSAQDSITVFQTCYNTDLLQTNKCIESKMLQFVADKFDATIALDLGLTGIININTKFKINKKGEIVKIKANSKYTELAKEAERVMSLLPKIALDSIEKNAVSGRHILPIVLVIDDKKEKEPKKQIKKIACFKEAENFKTNAKKKKYAEQKLLKFINKNFNTKNITPPNNNETIKVQSEFIVNRKGKISKVVINSKLKKINKEVARILYKLPKLIPGKINTISINTKYDFSFEIEFFNGNGTKNIKINNIILSDKTIYLYFLNTPIYPNCNEPLEQERKKCMSLNVQRLVGKKFNKELAINMGISGEIKIMVFFAVNKKGNISNIKVESKYDILSNEARRVIKLIPKIKPGMVNGKIVKVTYTLPIVFKIDN